MMKKFAEISNQNLVRNSDAYISNGRKIDPGNEFSWIDDSYKQGKEKFQLGYYFLGSNFTIWLRLYEELQFKLLLYLNANDLIILCYVSKYFRKLVLKKFAKIYHINTGFCSVKYWTSKIERNVFELIQAINNKFFESKAFDFEENYDKLIKRFRHMSLFSVCLHFLRCRGSCEKKHGYCKICPRVRDNTYYDYNKFSNLIVRSDGDNYLNISSSDRLDLDVFLNRPAYFQYPDYELLNGKCCHLEIFSFARDLFAAFCAVLVRMYLNCIIFQI